MAGIISAIFGAVELVVGFRFIFLLFAANPAASFVNWIYSVSSPLVAPFAGVLGQSTTVPSTGIAVSTGVRSVFEPSSLVALVVYAAIGVVLVRLFGGRSGGVK